MILNTYLSGMFNFLEGSASTMEERTLVTAAVLVMTYAIGDGIGGVGIIILVAHYVVKAQKRKQFFSYFLHSYFR